MIVDLRYLARKKYCLDLRRGKSRWDIYISAYNDSQRVKQIFRGVSATEKHWLMLPEYRYAPHEYPTDGTTHVYTSTHEADVIVDLLEVKIGVPKLLRSRICIDITGFMRPHILFLVKHLKALGVQAFDALYTEPERYGKKESTKFANDVLDVRQVAGYEGLHVMNLSDDILVIGVGYDDALMSRVANEKVGARQIQLLSLPSLSADMYQESILRLSKTDLADGAAHDDRQFFAPANDPFVVAHELSGMLTKLRSTGPVHNIYLSPLATKPQALGFAIFYLSELAGTAASIIFPFSKSYERETSSGIGRTWVYEVEF